MKLLIALIFYMLYWGICILGTGTDRKNAIGLRSYPDEVRAQVRSRLSVPREKSLPVLLLSNLLLFTAVFSALGLVLKHTLGFNGYWSAFWYFLALGEGLGVFDLVVIDLLWWRSTKRIRFSFLPEKAYYQDPARHIGSFVRGIPLFAASAALTAGIVTVL